MVPGARSLSSAGFLERTETDGEEGGRGRGETFVLVIDVFIQSDFYQARQKRLSESNVALWINDFSIGCWFSYKNTQLWERSAV